jgi:mono/diheme cytochrome c family protein
MFWNVTKRRIVLPSAIAAAILAIPFLVIAQSPAGNTSSGRQIATTICGNCHKVTSTMPSSSVGAPGFEDIANRPTTTALSLKRFLRSNHSRMPKFILSQVDTDDVIAYILSLKQKTSH